MAREGVPLIVIQRQLGHTNLGITSIYLEGIDSAEIIDTVHARRAPVVPVSSTLRGRTNGTRSWAASFGIRPQQRLLLSMEAVA